MKRYIRSSEELVRRGFVFEQGNHAYFLESNSSNITDKVARAFINAVCDQKGVGDAIRQSALYDEATLKDFKRRIDHATLETKQNSWGNYFTIKGNGFSLNFPEKEFNEEVILL